MEIGQSQSSTTSNLTKGILAAFVLSLLVSVYYLFTLPSDLRFKGNLQYTDLITPILIKLYLALGITAALAIIALFAEMKRIKVAIVYKDRSTTQTAEEKSQAESVNLDSLDSKAVGTGSNSEIVSNALNALAKRLNGVAGASYVCKEENGVRFAELVTGFALPLSDSDVVRFNYGDGMVGQVAKNGTPIYIDDIPDGYFQVVSGLGQASPKFILVLPLKKDNEVKGVIEVATFSSVPSQERGVAEKFAVEIGERLS